MDLSVLPSWAWDFAFVGFLFAMFYWMVSRTDRVGEKIHAVLTKLTDEFHSHQLQDAQMFAEMKAATKKPRKRAKAK